MPTNPKGKGTAGGDVRRKRTSTASRVLDILGMLGAESTPDVSVDAEGDAEAEDQTFLSPSAEAKRARLRDQAVPPQYGGPPS